LKLKGFATRFKLLFQPGTSFQFFPGGGGKILTDFLEAGGQNMKNTKFCRQKHQKVTIFKNQGGGEFIATFYNPIAVCVLKSMLELRTKSSRPYTNSNNKKQLVVTIQ